MRGKLRLFSLLLIGLFIMSSCVIGVFAKDKNEEIKVKQNTFFELDIPSMPDKIKNEKYKLNFFGYILGNTP